MDFGTVINILWLLSLVVFLVPYIRRAMLQMKRLGVIKNIEKKRKSRVITLIHRQETMSLLGIPISRYIDIEDSEEVLRAIRFTPSDMPIDMVLHTPGGLVLAAEQIACALKRHQGKVTVFVPHYAMSGGTLLALSADEIIMDSDAVLGPVDPQLGTAEASYPAVSIIKALEQPNPNRDDQTLIMGDIARKAIVQVYELVTQLLEGAMPAEKTTEIARTLTDGRWTHDYPISFEKARDMGLPVTATITKDIFTLMELYPQSGARRPSVEYIPTPYPNPDKPEIRNSVRRNKSVI
jgi:ClpP class serine protease